MITVLGRVWDKTHILSNNVSLSILGLSDSDIGKTGYFLLEKCSSHNYRVIKYVPI